MYSYCKICFRIEHSFATEYFYMLFSDLHILYILYVYMHICRGRVNIHPCEQSN